MEWSIHGNANAARGIAGLPPEILFSRRYVGNEFCEHLIPSPDALRRALDDRLPLTLLTPYVSDRGVARLASLFAILPPGAEVAFSDWGVLNVLRRDFPALVPVQGRLLHKALRDPRVMELFSDPLPALRQSTVENHSYREMLRGLGVRRVELDALPQGFDAALPPAPVSVYLPYGFVSTSRVCQAAGLHYRKERKFQPGAPCRHECQTHQVVFTYANSPFQNQDQQFLLKGNTYFYRQTEAAIASILALAGAGAVDRLVIQPELPMHVLGAAA
ncbi:MAG: hypothetical protein FJW40_01900 [Acidobacteria bacterium]|nr:hypothetical protein [Acidobacteriota bacterium]